jgi:hypothetical protein
MLDTGYTGQAQGGLSHHIGLCLHCQKDLLCIAHPLCLAEALDESGVAPHIQLQAQPLGLIHPFFGLQQSPSCQSAS